MSNTHSFHIPVMGIGFSIDTPLKVAKYGIDSVIFIGDDILLEKLRKKFCEKNNLEYTEIKKTEIDFRAKRITSYLNLIKKLSEKEFENFKNSPYQENKEFQKYIKNLPDSSKLKIEFNKLLKKKSSEAEISNWINNNLQMGDINVNIMTKLDKVNYFNGEQLPVEDNDAHSSLRAYAKSDLSSSLVFSAGMNPRLFAYIEKFKDFFPDKTGKIKKKIVLKVSDYRSALIQGKFLAKKGIWVSEYRIESGLNCGGHAFATEGFLMGPILEEFKKNKKELINSTHELFIIALKDKGIEIPNKKLNIRITAQGGIGTAEEQQFLTEYYNLDSIGWGTPFLLVPEVTNVDDNTLKQLSDAKEKDLYLSDISPLNIPFNNLRGNTKDLERNTLIDLGRPGSKCPKEMLALNSEFSDRTMCTASRQYQRLKIKDLDKTKNDISIKEYDEKYSTITEKSCICVGLGTSSLIVNDIEMKVEGAGISVCPGPNMAYYSQISTLEDMIEHIYGRKNLIQRKDRPMVFIKELGLYLEYLKKQIDATSINNLNRKQEKYLKNFVKNLTEGIEYYKELFINVTFTNSEEILENLNESTIILNVLKKEVEVVIGKELV